MRRSLSSVAAGLLVIGAAVAGTAAGAAGAAGAADKMCGGLDATIVGTPGDDVLTGTTGDDVIARLQGDDTIEALAGNDFVCGGEGTDTLVGGEGADKLFDGLGGGVLRGGPGNDNMRGAVTVGDDAQAVKGGPGLDFYAMKFVLKGGVTLSDLSGRVDLLHGRATIEAGHQETQLPVTGVEMLSVSRGRWTLLGSSRDETLQGGSHTASVAIFARGGRDELAGSQHHDVLDGGPGFDTLVHTTPGHDRCVSLERLIDGPC
jgi:Ca2+-binding RTX toxin-like protein